MNIHQAADGVCFASDLLWRGFTHFLTHTLQSAVLKMLGWKYVVASEFSLKESCFLWILSLNGGSQGVTILIKLLALTSNKFYVPHKTCELTLGWRSLLDVYCCGKWASIVRSGTGSISQTGTFGHFLIILESLKTHTKFCPRSSWYISLVHGRLSSLRCLSIYKSNHLSKTHNLCPVLRSKLFLWTQTYHLPFGWTISHLGNIINIFLSMVKSWLNIYPTKHFQEADTHTWKFTLLASENIRR